MRDAKNMRVFAPWISALERKLQRIDTIPVLMVTVGTAPIVASGDLGVEH